MTDSSAGGIRSLPENPHNSEITPSEINQPSLTSFFNPIFNKRSNSEENESEINMNELNANENSESNLNIDEVFPSGNEKRKKRKEKKSKNYFFCQEKNLF